jgi:hypothetical protein
MLIIFLIGEDLNSYDLWLQKMVVNKLQEPVIDQWVLRCSEQLGWEDFVTFL